MPKSCRNPAKDPSHSLTTRSRVQHVDQTSNCGARLLSLNHIFPMSSSIFYTAGCRRTVTYHVPLLAPPFESFQVISIQLEDKPRLETNLPSRIILMAVCNLLPSLGRPTPTPIPTMPSLTFIICNCPRKYIATKSPMAARNTVLKARVDSRPSRCGLDGSFVFASVEYIASAAQAEPFHWESRNLARTLHERACYGAESGKPLHLCRR